MAVAGGEHIPVRSCPTTGRVIARAKVDHIVAVKALHDVIASRLHVGQRPGPHLGTGPHRTIRELQHQRGARPVPRAQRAQQDQPVAGGVEGQHQVQIVRARPLRGEQITRRMARQDHPVGPAVQRVDPVVAIAGGEKIGVVARPADQQIGARTTVQRIGTCTAEDHVRSGRHPVSDQAGQNVGDGQLGSVRRQDKPFDAARG